MSAHVAAEPEGCLQMLIKLYRLVIENATPLKALSRVSAAANYDAGAAFFPFVSQRAAGVMMRRN